MDDDISDQEEDDLYGSSDDETRTNKVVSKGQYIEIEMSDDEDDGELDIDDLQVSVLIIVY